MPILSKHLLLTLLVGLVTAGVFTFFASSASNGILFIYLPALPLLLLGLSCGARAALNASFVAVAVAILSTDSGNALFFAGFIVLPTLYFVYRALLWRPLEDTRQWYPVLRILAEITVGACAFFMCISILAGQTDPGGLQAIVAHDIAISVDNSDPEIALVMKRLTGDLSFLLFAWTGWLSVLMFYALMVLANTLLVRRNLALRPRLGLAPYGIPPWVLGLLAISGAFAVLGQGRDLFESRTVFLLLLLPYFLSGTAFLHIASRFWRGRTVWLVLFYTALILSLWPAVLLVGMGLYAQLSEILDKRRQMR